jgi:hypothetical protein
MAKQSKEQAGYVHLQKTKDDENPNEPSGVFCCRACGSYIPAEKEEKNGTCKGVEGKIYGRDCCNNWNPGEYAPKSFIFKVFK